METFDVLVIGGGPGGSTAGALLAKAGKKTLLLEREKFPRFHIGESLLPYGNELFDALGIRDKIEAANFMPKHGAEFCTGDSKRFNRIIFKRGLTGKHPKAYQVERSKFDDMLLRHAQECGCVVREQALARDIEFDDDGVTLKYSHGGEEMTARARWIIDASGRETFLGRKLKLPRKEPALRKKIATFGHFKGVYRNPGEAEGHTTAIRLREGWFWIIPLDEVKTSVGLVQPIEDFKECGGDGEAVFARAIREHPEVKFRIGNAERLGPLHNTSDYTFRHEYSAGPRWLLVGDASGFLDPIFSTGVMIAMTTGRIAVRTLLRADAQNRALTAREQKTYTRRIYAKMDVFIRMIRAFYDDDAFEVFMQSGASLWRIPEAVTSLVAGHTHSDFGMWWRIKLFFLACWIQKHVALAPRIPSLRAASSTSS